MVLTEPQAGSDLGQVRTRAAPEGDHYRLFGQKIFITWGDHDLTANTIHMVLGRIDGAPAGVKGISLFIVPKFVVEPRWLARRAQRGALRVDRTQARHPRESHLRTRLRRAGTAPSPTSWGKPNRGLEYMFIMMNSARLSVGSEGYAVGERAFQRAAEWARTRVQGKPPVAAAQGPVPIINHPDVKRMLLTMKAQTEAARALDALHRLAVRPRRAQRRRPANAPPRRRAPICSCPSSRAGAPRPATRSPPSACRSTAAWASSRKPGAAQYVRDVRITTIYEGTTGIQSNDLLGRKLGRDRGATMQALLADMETRAQGTRRPRTRRSRPRGAPRSRRWD